MPTPTDYSIALYYGVTDSIGSGGTSRTISSDNFVPINPYDIDFNSNISAIAQADGGIDFADGFATPGKMIFASQHYSSTDADDLRETFEAIKSFLVKAAAANTRSCCVRMGLWNNVPDMIYRTQFARPTSLKLPMASKTHFCATTNAAKLTLSVLDPAWYALAAETHVIPVISGSGNVVINPVVGNLKTTRAWIKILNNTPANTPTNVIVTASTGGQFLLFGNLANTNDYWEIDCGWGTVTKNVSGTPSNDIASFTGSFLTPDTGSCTITVTDTASSTFLVTFKYLPRYC